MTLGISRLFNNIARAVRPIEVLACGDPKKMARYVKNRIVGKLLWSAINKSKILR
jgi:hypothetical protein